MIQRQQLIDSLRGFAIIVMILTHATAYFPNDKIGFAIWNWSNFAVPIFVFCSVYLFLKKQIDKPLAVVTFSRKRFVRLLVPYYIFLFFFIISLLLVSPEKVTIHYIWQSLLVIGGVDLNWLVLLFLSLTVILPSFIWSYQKTRGVFWLFFIVSLSSTVFLLFDTFAISYKVIMWLPWSLLLFFTLWYIRYENTRKILVWAFWGSLGIFIVSYAIQIVFTHSTVLIHNKYPPNIMYLSYGITVLLGLSFFEPYLFRHAVVVKIVNFFSTYSYSIFFIHYLILIVVAAFIKSLQLNWVTLFLIVLIITVLIQYGYNLAIHIHSQGKKKIS